MGRKHRRSSDTSSSSSSDSDESSSRRKRTPWTEEQKAAARDRAAAKKAAKLAQKEAEEQYKAAKAEDRRVRKQAKKEGRQLETVASSSTKVEAKPSSSVGLARQIREKGIHHNQLDKIPSSNTPPQTDEENQRAQVQIEAFMQEFQRTLKKLVKQEKAGNIVVTSTEGDNWVNAEED
jgi:hypothetical protein